MKKLFVSVLIPCLNESKTIKKVIVDAKGNSEKYFKNNFEIVIADNGSTDGTLQILKSIKNIRVIKVKTKGYGSALHQGILSSNGDYVIFADADLSYPFLNLSRFKEVIDKNYDLVLGTRIKGKIVKNSMPVLHRYIGTPLLTQLINIIYGFNSTDCNSGMRMIKKSFYKKLNMRNSGMEWASELLCKTALKHGFYGEVPIKFSKDLRGRRAHLSTWSDGWRHLKAILLIKPVSVLYISFISIFLSMLLYKFSFSITFLFLVIAQVFFLSFLTLKLLETIIEKRLNFISSHLIQFKIVPLLIILTIVQFVLLLIISDQHMGTKLMLIAFLGVTYMWAFLIETIKTHLVNNL